MVAAPLHADCFCSLDHTLTKFIKSFDVSGVVIRQNDGPDTTIQVRSKIIEDEGPDYRRRDELKKQTVYRIPAVFDYLNLPFRNTLGLKDFS